VHIKVTVWTVPRREREPSMLGDEEIKLTPDELYSEYNTKSALEDARFVYDKCCELTKSI
jgi:HEPN domain-containing protein